MHASQPMHILERGEHLPHEEATRVLAHRSLALAQVEEQTTCDVLHDDEDQVAYDAARWLYHVSRITEVKHLDDATLLEVLENRDLILYAEDGIFVTSEELFFQDFDGH